MTGEFPEGDGIFETIKTIHGVPFALSRHLERARRSAVILGMRIQSESQIRREVATVLATTPDSLEFGRLRVSFHKSGEIELTHETYHPWTSPARLTILDRPINENSPLIGIKTLPFTENIECLRLAHEAGFDDGIRFNSKGNVAESAVSNLLINIDGRWVTPSLESGCLPGITRGLALEWFEVEERTIPRDVLGQVEAMYLLSSLKDAQPVSVLEERTLVIDSDLGREFINRRLANIDP